ncbi:MAG: tetratricopeptide repeat protein [Acidobacteria bacterium]|nr:tetratricopeptide repeat protein [Acidobacteriota bacterium]
MTGSVRFGAFEFDPDRRELRKHGLRIRVPDQSLDILVALVEHPGQTVTRERIQSLLWPHGTVVGYEQSINTAVSNLREALGDPADAARFIERVPRQGYRFAAPVEPLRRAEPGASPPGARRPTLAVLAAAATTAAAAIAGWLWMRSAPALAERDVIVIADFENQTGEEVFNDALRQALLSQMGQSPYLSLLSEDRIRSALAMMGRASDGPLTRAVAREVCQRVGGKAVLAGSIGRLGSRYFVGLEAVGCAGGEELANEYTEAESKDRVLAALSLTVSKMRGRLGESLASIRKLSVPAEVTTPSLEALRAYSIALTERSKGNDAAPLLERAIQLDPEFAAAHFTLAHVHFRRGQELSAEEAIARAYALRGRASEREKLAIESAYHIITSGDFQQAIVAGTLAAQLYPHDAAARRSAFLPHGLAGEFDKALQIARREIELAPDDAISYFNLAVLLLSSGRTVEARAVLDKAGARSLSDELFPFARYIAAALEGDSAAMEREAEAARGKPYEHRILMLQVQVAGFFGQLAKARETARDASARNVSSGPAIAATVALTEAVFGLEQDAKARAKAALQLDRARRTAATTALTLALTNETVAAEAVLGDLLRRYPNDTLLNSIWSPAVRGVMALKRGDARGAVQAADAPRRSAWPAYSRGIAYLRLGLASEAAAEFRTIIEQKARLFTSTFVYGAAFAYPAAQVGLARALAMEGKVGASRKAYEEFLAGWSLADSGIPILVQARREYAALRVP